MKIPLQTRALYGLAAFLVIYNFILLFLLKKISRSQDASVLASVRRIVVLQTLADLVILTAVLHFSGGIENPFFLYFLFHVIIASALFPKWLSYLEATLAVILFGLLISSEYLQLVPHYGLQGFFPATLFRDGPYVLGMFFVFATTVYLVSYMASSISEQLRRQQAGYRHVNALLQAKDYRQNEYVSRVTHDIKGHLSAVKSCLDIVTAKMVGTLNEKQFDLIQRAAQRTTKCMSFVKALRRLSNLRLTDKLEMENFSLKNAVIGAIAAVDQRAASKSISISYDIGQSAEYVYGNDVLIEETISNILMNAVKYTPDSGSIKIETIEAMIPFLFA